MMHLAISASSASSMTPFFPKYLTKAFWPASCAPMKLKNVDILSMCWASSVETSLSALSLAWKRRKRRRNLSTRKTRAMRMMPEISPTPVPPPVSSDTYSTILSERPNSPSTTKKKSKTLDPDLKYLFPMAANFAKNSKRKRTEKKASAKSQPIPLSSSARCPTSTATWIPLATIATHMQTLKVPEATILLAQPFWPPCATPSARTEPGSCSVLAGDSPAAAGAACPALLPWDGVRSVRDGVRDGVREGVLSIPVPSTSTSFSSS
mmetsp:Transcript_26720/g.62254  ORF Transcript_26720/g.62254 Transcript_26720/m.62254 type:complete len:265 (+) Transcript_26720:757-1551(+)